MIPGRALLVRRAGRPDQVVSTLAELEADAKCCAAFDGGAAIGLTDGTLLFAAADGRETRVLDRAGAAQSRLGVAAATAGYSGNVVVVYLDGAESRNIVVHRDADKLHHLAAGDLDGDGRAELIACGYSGAVTLVRFER